jgi:hypothetical protein
VVAYLDDKTSLCHVRDGDTGHLLSVAQVMTQLMRSDHDCTTPMFVHYWVAQLAQLGEQRHGGCYFFECHPITASHYYSTAFEFVLLSAPVFARISADAQPFAEHFARTNNNNHEQQQQQVVVFANLGGNSLLLAPTPTFEPLQHYAHLGAFMRGAPVEQQLQLWRQVGIEVHKRVAHTRVVYLSTSGLGVYWLHIRLDPRPKYYTYRPYRASGY